MSNSRHPEKRIITAWVHQDEVTAFKQICEAKGMTLSAAITELIQKEIKKSLRKKGK
jgi:antitoxin component of RelBE/YafQ-DinJ toxin-antitoxin module